ncbi:cryptochrome DASH, chloroplastic/mitochondrial isoform X2 [Punica granatum]|uniref:Cryptochrome DASH n=2 Tax=Punica granatum TaxID=22663 RepID=A0A6P8BW66_PUNGR|nr:cryptochrome DASH, chloroplastic/mitochondrial isoform X2 [Punica granatum]
MAISVSPLPLLPLRELTHHLSIPTSKSFLSSRIRLCFLSQIMGSSSRTEAGQENVLFHVPDIDSGEMEHVADRAFHRYCSASGDSRRNGKGTVVFWFRNDLRVIDNEALYEAWSSSEAVLPVYCVDPRLFGTTHYFGFPKTGALRAQFLLECLDDLKKNLVKRGLNLLIKHGKPEEILPSVAKAYGAHTVYAQQETCSEELSVEKRVNKALQQVVLPNSKNPKLRLIWGSTMYHIDDLPFNPENLPDVYTQFRKSVESKCKVRGCVKVPELLGPTPSVTDWGSVPTIDQLGLQFDKVRKGIRFLGGESAALGRVFEYFWKKDLLRVYKNTRNGMLGADYSTKFSPWLATGCVSPRFIYEEVKRYEKERQANDSTYWVLFELIWRDYFRFLSIKCGNSLFHLGGPRKVQHKWSQDPKLFESWREGRTGYPLIDANMLELSITGFMSNRGRQIVCSFLVRDMGIDWRMGAEWFETCLLDYDPCSNYGNWTYGAGVGNDPREDRYFSIPKQSQTYDPEGEYVAFWLPQLQSLPKDRRHFPGNSYIPQIVQLKFGNTRGHQSGNPSRTTRQRDSTTRRHMRSHQR